MFCIHHNDLDGYASARLVAEYTDNFDKERYFEWDYFGNIPIEKIQKNEKVYIVDCSFSEHTIEILKSIQRITNDIIWIDHHKTTMELIQNHEELGNIKGMRVNDISAAALTYMFLYKQGINEIPLYIRMISDYDTWKYEYGKDTEYFFCYMESMDYKNINDNVWILLKDEHFLRDHILENGKMIKRYIEKKYQVIKNEISYEKDIDGHKALIINSEGNSWLFGEDIEKYDLCVKWIYTGNRYKYTIYSHSNVDASLIASKYGGGGHKAAAGFSSDKQIW